MGRTDASEDSPGACSSSGVVPSALAITAPRPKNILAELPTRHISFTMRHQEEEDGRTLSNTA